MGKKEAILTKFKKEPFKDKFDFDSIHVSTSHAVRHIMKRQGKGVQHGHTYPAGVYKEIAAQENELDDIESADFLTQF